jgi:4-hydroxy-tetrahydrodipicolinate synthase
MPIILYDVPGRTMVELQVDTIKKLSSIKNIVGIKDATGNIDKAVSIRENCEDDFIILSGDDETFLQSMIEAKANGTISVTANVFPKSMHDICKCVENNDIEQARKINKSILPMHKALFVESNPIPVKYALNKMEKIPSGIRLPLSWLSDKQKNKLDIALEATKKFK